MLVKLQYHWSGVKNHSNHFWPGQLGALGNIQLQKLFNFPNPTTTRIATLFIVADLRLPENDLPLLGWTRLYIPIC